MIRCADGTTYHGDVLVGSDGAHSAVRQSLYKQMSDSKILPATDALDLNKGYTCLVGTTSPLDPVKFPVVSEKDNGGVLVIGNNNGWVVKTRRIWEGGFFIDAVSEVELPNVRRSVAFAYVCILVGATSSG